MAKRTDGWITIGTKLETKDFRQQIKQLENDISKYQTMIKNASKLHLSDESVERYRLKLEKAKNSLSDLRKKQAEVDSAGLRNVEASLDKIGSGMSSVIKSIGKWTLAIFAVRSAYSLIRNSISTLSQYNEQLAKDLEYIRFSVASILQPVVEGMVNIVYKLLQYINYIANAWFGVNLFANATAKSMNKSVKSAKELKNQLAGFDEMNVLSDTSGGGAGGGGDVGPSVDLSQMLGDQDVPGWLLWIKENKDEVLIFLAAVAAGFVAIQLAASPMTILIGLVVGLFAYLVAEVIKHWDEIAEIIGNVLGFIWDNIKDFFETLFDAFKGALSIIGGILTFIIEIIATPFRVAFDLVTGLFKNMFDFIKNIIKGIAKFFTGDLKGALNSFKDAFKNVFNALWTIAKAPINLIIGGINALIKGLNKISFDVPDWVPVIGGNKLGFNIPEIPRLAVGGIVNMPGRGINYGGANIAERGPEGIIPLTNSQSMAQLGEAIGKYITINANIVNTMNGRVISKELKKIQDNSDFAFNR